jgi:hypothetical protein
VAVACATVAAVVTPAAGAISAVQAGSLRGGFVLRSGRSLAPGMMLKAQGNGPSRLVMRKDGNLVLLYVPVWQRDRLRARLRREHALAMSCRSVRCAVNAPRIIWQSRTSGHPGARLVMRPSGDLQVALRGAMLWHTATGGHPGAVLALLYNGHLRVIAPRSGKRRSSSVKAMAASSLPGNGGGIPVWDDGTSTPQLVGSQLNSGQALAPNQYLESPSGQYELYMSPNGTATVFNNTSGTACPTYTLPYLISWDQAYVNDFGGVYPGTLQQPARNADLVMQNDGDLVLYAPGPAAEWASDTSSSSGADLVMQNDGNLVVYAPGGKALWATGGDQILGGALCPGDQMTTSQRLAASQYEEAGTPSYTYLTFAPHDKSKGMELDIDYGAPRPDQLWSDSSSPTSIYLVQQRDGNLVIYPTGSSTALWATATNNNPGAFAVIEGHPVSKALLVESVSNQDGTLYELFLWGKGPGFVLATGSPAVPIPWSAMAP